MKIILKNAGFLLVSLLSAQAFGQTGSAVPLPPTNPTLAAPPKLDLEPFDKNAVAKRAADSLPAASNSPAPASAPGLSVDKPDVKKNETKERREGGKVTEVEVTSGGSTYKLQANPNVGNAPEGTVQGTSNRPALWSIFQFGGPKKESKDEKEVEPVLQPVPPKPKEGSVPASIPTSTPANK
jgi:hypothetical protein